MWAAREVRLMFSLLTPIALYLTLRQRHAWIPYFDDGEFMFHISSVELVLTRFNSYSNYILRYVCSNTQSYYFTDQTF